MSFFFSFRYDPSDMGNLFSHLTNASVNKLSPDLLTEKDVIGSGCKWTMSRWFDHLESVGVNPYVVWERIKDIAILTLLPIVSEVPDNTRCFELFGFDIMLDETFTPWIIEVNASPAIAIAGKQDTTVKIVRRRRDRRMRVACALQMRSPPRADPLCVCLFLSPASPQRPPRCDRLPSG